MSFLWFWLLWSLLFRDLKFLLQGGLCLLLFLFFRWLWKWNKKLLNSKLLSSRDLNIGERRFARPEALVIRGSGMSKLGFTTPTNTKNTDPEDTDTDTDLENINSRDINSEETDSEDTDLEDTDSKDITSFAGSRLSKLCDQCRQITKNLSADDAALLHFETSKRPNDNCEFCPILYAKFPPDELAQRLKPFPNLDFDAEGHVSGNWSSWGRFRYRPMPQDRSEIRLIKLQPGPPTADLQIDIFHVKLSLEPRYEALSYVWGLPGAKKVIYVQKAEGFAFLHNTPTPFESFSSRSNMKEHHNPSVLHITQNLFDALRHLRHSVRPRILWIDAICINQEDIPERSTEVLQMGAIYRNAYRVVVWLGPDHSNSSLAANTLQRIGEDVRYSKEKHGILSKPGSWPDTLKTNLEIVKSHADCWFAIRDLLAREWFSRLWTYQEIILATNAAVVVGNHTIDWKVFVGALHWIRASTNHLNQAINGLKLEYFEVNNIGPIIEAGCQPTYYSLSDALNHTRKRACQDDRDRMYAIRSLLWPRQRDIIVPDYSRSTEELYKNFARKWIFETKNANVLTFCELQDRPTRLHLPSWVPDLSNSGNSERQLSNCRITGYSRVFAVANDDDSVNMKGVQIGNLSYVTLPAGSLDSDTQVVELCRTWMEDMCSLEEYVAGGSSMDAFSETIIGGGFAERMPSHRINACPLETIKDLLIGNDSDSQALNTFATATRRMVNGRVIFKTAEGFIGLGPGLAREGDLVAVILGCDEPIVLRPADSSSKQCFRVVGPCYVAGISCAEALLGPLPASWSWRFDELQKFSRVVFTTGERRTQQDPRMPLPKSWRYMYGYDGQEIEAKKLEDMTSQWFENVETGERTRCDPRLTPEILTGRGIAIKDFILI